MLSYRTILEYSTNESTFSNQFMTRTTSMPLFRKRKINLSTSRSSKKIKPMQNFELINHIKNRKAHQEKIITPEVALEVLRKYLLPMFEADGRNVKARTRPSIYGVAQSSDRSRTENKLSDIIGKELKQMKEELQILKSKLEITETEKEKIKNEVCNYNEMLITSSCTLEMMKYQSESAKQSILRAELNSTSVNQQIGEYQHLTSVKESEKLLIGELLSKERNRNVTLDNKSNELQHWHALFQMQSDIMGERLKGLYLACENITSSAKGKDKLVNENNKLRQNVIDIFFYDLQCNELCKMTITNSKDYVHNNYSQSIQRISYREEAVNLRQHMKEVLKQKSKQINHANDEKDFLEQKCLGLEKKFNELNEGYKKMRQQMAELNLKRKLNGLDEEKLCKYCNKNYFDKDNFNWSCSLHPGKWNGSMYWCCGKIKEDAPGCVRSKHELKDENEEEALNPEEKKTYKKCSSCKDVGHPAHQCPRDPNTRSNVDVTTEIDRISLVKKQRTKIGPKSHEKSKRLVSLLSPKNGGSDIIELSNRTQMEFNDIEEIRDEAVNTTIDITSIAKAGLTEKSLSRRSVKRRTIKEMRESHFIDESISELFVASKNNIMTSGSPLELN